MPDMSEEKPVHTEASIEKAYAAYLLALAARRPDCIVQASKPVPTQAQASPGQAAGGLKCGP